MRDADLERADVLRDAAGLAGRDRGGPQRVEEGRLAVVDVAEDAGDGRAGGELLGGREGQGEEVEGGFVVDLGVEAELEGEEGSVFGGEDCVEREEGGQ